MIPKFRVFDRKFKEMEEVYLIDWQWPGQDAWINDNPSDNLIFMQSTGLHDKNGVEMFEGDILKSQDGTDGLISRFIVEKDDFYTGFIPMNREGYGFNRTMCEVIGNIYENPELLEV